MFLMFHSNTNVLYTLFPFFHGRYQESYLAPLYVPFISSLPLSHLRHVLIGCLEVLIGYL